MCSSKTTKKVAMVTGGASGIGTATCRRFAKEGYIPVIVDVNLEAAEPLAAELGGMAVQTDVTSYDACVAAAKKVYETYGRIDILVCCAGGASGRMLNMPGKFHEVPISRLEWGINLNLMGAMYMAHAVVNYMVEAKYGKIVFLGSVAGVVGAIGGADYSASKGGLESLTKSLGMELAPYGINVNIVSPGLDGFHVIGKEIFGITHDLDLYEITASKLTGKASDANGFLCVSRPRGVGKKRDSFGYVVENVFVLLGIGAADCQGDDLSSSILNCRLDELHRIFARTENETGVKFVTADDKFVVIHFFFLFILQNCLLKF